MAAGCQECLSRLLAVEGVDINITNEVRNHDHVLIKLY